MAHKLYVYLTGGRGDAYVTDAWDGAPPEEEGTLPVDEETPGDGKGLEASEPYRDIFPASTQSWLQMPNPDGGTIYDSLTAMSGVIMKDPQIGGYYVPIGGGSLTSVSFVKATGTPSFTTSDEVGHEKPRQTTKVCTWLVFEEEGTGATFKFRKNQVIGWGKNPRA